MGTFSSVKAQKHFQNLRKKQARQKAVKKSLVKLRHKLTPKNSKKQSQRIRLRRTLAIYGVAIVLTALVALGAAISTSRSQNRSLTLTDPFSSTQRAAIGFTAYYPARLPAGYQVDTTALNHVQASILTYRILDGNGTALTITEQKIPDNFNVDTLYSTFGNKATLKTKLGPVTVGTIDEGKTYLTSLITPDKTWVLLSTSITIPQKDLQTIFEHLQPSK